MPDYFTLAELRALPDCTGSTFSDAQIEAASAHFVSIVEREVGGPFIPRSYTDTLDGNGCLELLLGRADVRSLTSVTVDGVSVSTSLLTATNGVLRYLDRSTVWPTTAEANVVAVYSAGEYTTCPADMKDATLWATRDRLLSQSDRAGIDARRTSVTTEFGTTSYVLPGEKRPTGYPELDALIASYQRTSPAYGFA